MSPIALALATSYLDALQDAKEWQLIDLRETVRKYYFNISPHSRRAVMNELDKLR
jgi:hypothetical protein